MRARRGSLADGPKRASALERDTVGAIHTHDGELGEALFVGSRTRLPCGPMYRLGSYQITKTRDGLFSIEPSGRCHWP